jgi:predicted enzyme related to lactoylglutathione lyase
LIDSREEEQMANTNIKNIVAVLPVGDHQAAVAWYAQLLGREADLVPTDGVAEWQLTDTAWLQVGADPERSGSTTVVIGVHDLETQRAFCEKAGVPLGEVVEYPDVIRMAETADPDGNTVTFVQDLSGSA